MLGLLAGGAHARAESAEASLRTSEAWLDVRVNGSAMGTSLVRRSDTGRVLVKHEDVQAWRLALPAADEDRIEGETYDALDNVSGLAYHVDEGQQILFIDVPPAMFETTRMRGRPRGWTTPSPSAVGVYLDYDASVSRAQGSPSASAALLELGIFGPHGTLVNTMLAGQPTTGGTQRLRLESTWTTDQPEHAASLRIGDAISGGSDWGRSVRFGGVQFATDFSTQPGLITYPLPSLSGTAATPSTVDLYVNNALRLRQDVPTGPFDITDLPVVTGQGNMQLVVRDLLGREQVISAPFNTGGGLLAHGLRSFSYELGFERRNYGLTSNDYGKAMLAATERRGLSDSLTGELHAEALPGQYTLGASGAWLWSTLGVAHLSVAASHADHGGGATVGAGFDHQGTAVSYGIRGQLRTSRFAELGYDTSVPAPTRTGTAYMALRTGLNGSMTLNYTREDLVGQPSIRIAGANFNLPLGRQGYLSASAIRFLNGGDGTAFNLSYTRILGPRDSVAGSGRSQGASQGGSVSFRHAVPTVSGIGYGVEAGLSSSDSSRADLEVKGDTGTYSVEAARIAGQDGLRATARGSLVLVGGNVYASRHLDDSFAAVAVPGFPNVRVYADNQPIATTDANGNALVPGLRAYQDNPIRIEQADLPMDAQIDTTQIHVVPSRHGGVSLVFPVTRERAALLTLVQPDGSFVPASADVRLGDHGPAFPVGERGEVYLTDLTDTNDLVVHYQRQSCRVRLESPRTDDPLPRVGPLTCMWSPAP